MTVLFKLPDLVSTAHLVNALLILAGLIILAEGTPAHAAVPPRLKRLATAGLAALLLQLALGGYVRHAGAGLACPDFPLCSGSVLPHHWESVVHWIHRWLGVALLGLFVHLALAARRTALARAAALAAGLWFSALNVKYRDVRYAIRRTNDRRNLVFPFYVIPGE